MVAWAIMAVPFVVRNRVPLGPDLGRRQIDEPL